ncbi:MAG: methyltransferase MtaB domain-containing protein [Bacillota bacterium]
MNLHAIIRGDIAAVVFALGVLGVRDMNSSGKLRDWMVDSDSKCDPQAFILRPDVVYKVSSELIRETDPLRRTKKAVMSGLEQLKKAAGDGSLALPPRERPYIETLLAQTEVLPDDPLELWNEIQSDIDETSSFRRNTDGTPVDSFTIMQLRCYHNSRSCR